MNTSAPKGFSYKPSRKFLWIGLGQLYVSGIFFIALYRNNDFLQQTIFGLFGTLTFLLSVFMLWLFFFSEPDIVSIDTEKIIYHYGEKNKRKKLLLSEVISAEEVEGRDTFLIIKTKRQKCIIEKNYMRKKDYDTLRQILEESISKNTK